MSRLPLIGGAQETRSVLGNAQRAINYFPEINRPDAPVPMTHYQRPGLKPLVSPGAPAPNRCLYQASNGTGYTVIGSGVYAVDPAWNLTLLGNITPARSNPVSIIDNGQSLVIVDGSPNQWQVDLVTQAFAPLVDPSGNFAGADRVDTLDGFVIWNRPATRQYGATFDNLLTTDGLSVGSKGTYPDPLQTLIVRRTEVVLLGALKGEIHYNVGNVQFPFARLPGAYIEYGCAAKYSVAAIDISVFWLSRSLEGKSMVLRLKGYEVTEISTPWVVNKIDAIADISDARGYCYQQKGHVFYQLIFPSGDLTLTFDDSIRDPMAAWHQRCWTDSNGALHRVRDNCFALINNTPVVGDWENGTIYQLDNDTYTDTVAGTVGPISFIRGFPHISKGYDAKGQLVDTDGKSLTFKRFSAQLEGGNGPLDVNGKPAVVGLRWSDDRGRSWGQTVLQSDGAPGEYATDTTWPGPLGISKYRVFELIHSIAGQAALNGAWIDAVVNQQ